MFNIFYVRIVDTVNCQVWLFLEVLDRWSSGHIFLSCRNSSGSFNPHLKTMVSLMETVGLTFLSLLVHPVMATKISEMQIVSPHPVCHVCYWCTCVLAFKIILSIVSFLSVIRCGKAECVVHMAAGWLPSIWSLPWFPFGVLRFREHWLHVLFHILLCLLWAPFYIHSRVLRLPRIARLSQVCFHITPTSSPAALPTAFTIRHLPLQPPHCFLSALERSQYFHQASLWIKHTKVLTELNTFSKSLIFFHTERTFQQNQINFKHSLLNASRGVCTNILPWQEFWRMCIESFFLGSERTMCNSVVEKALLKAIEGGIYWVEFQILLHLYSVSCSADSHLMKA